MPKVSLADPWQQELGSELTLVPSFPGSRGDQRRAKCWGVAARREILWGIPLEMGQESALAQTLLGLPSRTEQLMAGMYFWPLHLVQTT